MRAKIIKSKFWKTIEIAHAVILISLIFSFTVPAASAGNLIENPGFENGIDVPVNWILMEQNDNIPVWDNAAHSGLKSIKISVPEKNDFRSGYPQSDIIKVQPSGNYTVTAWGKTIGAGGTNTPAVRVVELDSNNNPVIQDNLPVFSEGTNDWEQRTLDFQTGPDTAYIYIYANIWDGYGTFWLDDVTLFSRDNLIENPGFENGITVPFNWTLIEQNGNIPLWDNAAYTGSKSIKIDVPGKADIRSGYPESDLINVQPLSNYFISAWGKTTGAGGTHTPAVRVVELDSNRNMVGQSNLPVFSEGTNDWEQKILDLKTGQDTAYIYIYANIWDGYGTFWLDDVTVSYIVSTGTLHSTPASDPTPDPTPAPTHTATPTPTPTPTPDTPKGTYYVAKNGNDNNPGTESKPWQTITKAANTLEAGETVYVKEGTYNEQVTVRNSGSSGKYITFSAYPGDSVTLDGNGLSMEDWSGLFWIKDVDYIKVIGFNLKNGKNGVDVNGGSNIIIKDNYIENPYHTGVKVGWEYSSNIIIDGNKVKKNIKSNWDEMISISNGHNVEVKNNHIMENAIGEGIDMKDGTSDSTIHHNEVEKVSSAGVYIDGYADGVSDIEIYENTVHDSDIGFSTGSERGGLTQNIYFHDNTAYNTNTGYRKSYWTENGHEANYKNIVFSNNKAYNNQVDYSGIS